MKFLLVLLAALVFTGWQPVASAQNKSDVITNEAIAEDGLLYEAVKVADQFWADYDMYPCKGDIYVYDEGVENVVARAHVGGCDVWWSRRYVRDVRRSLARESRMQQRSVLKQLCMIAIHERGHNLGFDHEPGGSLMSVTVDHPVVGRCIAWATKLTPNLQPEHPFGL